MATDGTAATAGSQQTDNDDPSKFLVYDGQPPAKPEPKTEQKPEPTPEPKPAAAEPAKPAPQAPPAETAAPKREVDKDLQQIQQQIATQQKQLEALVAAKTPDEQAKARAALEKTKGRLDAMLKIAGANPETIDPFTAPPQIAEAAHEALQGVEALTAKQRELQEGLAQVQAAQRALDAERRAASFERANPELAGRFKELSEKAREATNAFFGEDADKIPDSAWSKMAAKQLEDLVAQEKSKAKPAGAPPKPAAQPGGSTAPVVKNGLPPTPKPSVLREAEEATEKYVVYAKR